jgi:hypothetical protein
VDPQLIMRRTQRTLLGISCIAGGCAALVWMLSNSHGVGHFAQFFENHASADEAAAPLKAEAEAAEAVTPVVAAESNVVAKTDALRDADLAPQSRVIIPAGRPSWVEEDFSHEQGDVQRVAISSGPFNRKHDALRALDEELAKATRTYIGDYLGSRAAEALVPVDVSTIRRELVQPANIFHEQIQISELGPMFQSHALLEFGPSFREKINERWKSIVVAGRVAKFGVIGIGVLMALSVVMGYFKADNATRGYYTTRLQVGTAGAILALVAGGVLLLRYL